MYGGATVIACGVAVHLYSLSMGKWTINTCGSIVGALVCAVLATFALQKVPHKKNPCIFLACAAYTCNLGSPKGSACACHSPKGSARACRIDT
eukprot:1392405-Amorphochlora_amoeboformis.AAC.1